MTIKKINDILYIDIYRYERSDKMNKENLSTYFKIIGDKNRLQIIEMVSCEEMCANNILEKLKISQATLSHHMKILVDNNIVLQRKEGKWNFYSLNENIIKSCIEYFSYLGNNENCICHKE